MRLGVLLGAILCALTIWGVTLLGLSLSEAIAAYVIVASVGILIISRRTE